MIARRILYALAFLALFVVAPIYGNHYWCLLLMFAIPGFVLGVGIGRLTARKG
jgi:hypothetical protein